MVLARVCHTETKVFPGWRRRRCFLQPGCLDIDRQLYQHPSCEGGAEFLLRDEGPGLPNDCHPEPQQPELDHITGDRRRVLVRTGHSGRRVSADEAF